MDNRDMDAETPPTDLLEFFKALSDANRLKIVGLLAQEELSAEQIAAMLDLRPSTVSHHLSYLVHVGLVSARAESYYNIYRLEVGALEAMAKRLLSRETFKAAAADVDTDAYDRKVLQSYLRPDGSIKAFPTQLKKLTVILRHVVQAFEPGVRYSEKQVNDILSRYHEDTATLRRELVESGLMAREGGGRDYWRV